MELVNKGSGGTVRAPAVSATAAIMVVLLLAALIAGICLGDVFETYHNASSL